MAEPIVYVDGVALSPEESSAYLDRLAAEQDAARRATAEVEEDARMERLASWLLAQPGEFRWYESKDGVEWQPADLDASSS